MKKIFSHKLSFFLLAVIFVWAKTYASYLLEFNLGVKGSTQQFLLFINPLSFTIVFLGLALFAKGRRAAIWMIILDAVMTFVLYANILFYRFFDDFLTFANLKQAGNLGNMSDGVFAIMSPHDFIYIIDLVILIALCVKRPELKASQLKKRWGALIVLAGVLLFYINLQIAEKDRPELLTRTFDRNYIVKYLGPYNYTIYDGVQAAQNATQKAYASSDDLTSVINYTNSHYAKPNDEYFGAAKGKNIIKIHLESFQSLLIDYKLNGKEVTPFLNKLAHGGEDMTYFDNFFHQTGQGKTADAELMMDNSLFGLPEGTAFVTKGQNTYQSLPAILNQKEGYTSAVLHGDYKSFWNRDQVYKQIGYDKFFDASSYDMSEDNLVNLGLKDKPFFEESIPMLKSLKQPFYAHLLTLTNHYPFILDEKDATLERGTTGDDTVDGYFQTARYLDEALEQFFKDLKKEGLLDDSVIVIYGDHNGISENHNRAMKEVLGKEITSYQNAMNQRVPLMIRVPGKKGGVNHTYGGETDVMPTLLHLQGIDNKNYINFGTDLFSKDHDETVAFRNGNYVTPKYTMIDSTVYDTKTGKELKPNKETENLKKQVAEKLNLSDQVLYKDLLRFHKLSDFTPVDPSKYHYGKEKTGE
ncbi:LTA synthase family protein [Bacillus glycinifermentans]|uniref:LTA synthase family protein n=1 Tax=Bacillus glycinifermentans TaxID=1664069 RepID=UPI002DB63063|nr:LTA synthase family protein [Bacillus glycinifermentans]MEC3608157.1 LTA synthase family protein [Bacillus glycinifermentans]